MRKIVPILIAVLLVVLLPACQNGTATPDISTATPGGTPRPVASGCRSLPPITAGDWTIGPDDAPIVLVEYAEFQ
ncbi:MAG: hypothetical protein JW900_13305 [Anaerolineae bacterium]|nr:hypothetical protein [Anaerolineae bacterium]